MLAIARGGNPGYTFAWNDGVTTNAREICTVDDLTFTVSVADTPFVDDEFSYAGQTTAASVSVEVLSCPGDGGVADGGGRIVSVVSGRRSRARGATRDRDHKWRDKALSWQRERWSPH